MSILANGALRHNTSLTQDCFTDMLARVSSPDLTIKIDGVERNVPPTTFDDDIKTDALACAMTSSTLPAIVRIARSLLDFTDQQRQRFLDTVLSVSKTVFVGREDGPLDLLTIAGQIVCFDPSDVTRSGRGYQLVVEIIGFGNESDFGVSSQIGIGILKNAGYMHVKASILESDAKAFRKRLREKSCSANASQVVRVKCVLPDAPVSDDAVVPTGWVIRRSGITSQNSNHIYAPIVVCERGRDDRGGSESLQLAWLNDGAWVKATVDRMTAADSRLIITLADKGFPVNSLNAKDIVAYLAAYENANNATLPRFIVSHRLGWHNDFAGFLWGHLYVTETHMFEKDECYSGRVHFRGSDDGDNQIADGFHPSGTLAQWLEAVAAALQHPVPRFAICAALVPVLAPIIGSSNFAISFSGPTSVGKTTTLRAVASVWGCPFEQMPSSVVSNFNSTQVFRDRLAAICRHLPVCFEETQHCAHPEDVGKTIYGIIQGRAKQRGTIRGIGGQDPIETVLFMTGERAAIEFTERDGGIRARVLEFWGKPFAAALDSGKLVADLLNGIRGNYGTAGPAFVQFLLRNRGIWGEFRSCYLSLQRKYELKGGTNAVAIRMAGYFAAVELTSILVHNALKFSDPWVSPVTPVYDQLIVDVGEADRAAAALRCIMDWAIANPRRFIDSGHSEHFDSNNQGWAGRWVHEHKFGMNTPADSWESIALFPHVIAEVLKNSGFDHKSSVRLWRDRGWLKCDGDSPGRTTATVRIGDHTTKAIVILRSAIEESVQTEKPGPIPPAASVT